MTGLAETLAEFALAPADNAEAARAVMRLSLLDWAAVGIAGQDEPVARLLRDIALDEGGRLEAGLFGAGPARVPARAAALVNGATSHALDYDDTHFAHIGHPSVAVIPAALALAQTSVVSGPDFLDAALIGAEASIRTGLWLGRSHYQAGFHQTATAGAIGATLAAARLLGLSRAQTAQALGLASTRAAGLKSQFGSMGKPYHAGLAAQTGVEAAGLARAGFVSNPAGLDGPQGFGPTHAGAGDMAGFDGIGQTWHFETVSHKFHACCHGTHAMIEALAQLNPAPDAVSQVAVTTHPRWLSVCDIARPATGLEVKFSYRHIAAMVLSGLDTAALDSFTDAIAADPMLVALASKVRVAADPGIAETAARVTVTLTDGISRSAEHDLDTPMTLAARQRRLLSKAAALVGRERADALWQAILAGPDLAFLLQEISSPKA